MKKITKWGLGLVMTLAMMFMASQASAAQLGLYQPGQLVPKVIHNGANVDTVVGLTCRDADLLGNGCDVYWTFFDVDSNHITDGMFHMTDDEYSGFSWMAESGAGLEDVDGYLVFTSGVITAPPVTHQPCATLNPDIFVNAFAIDTAGNDAVFLPVLPLSTTWPPTPGTTGDYDPALVDDGTGGPGPVCAGSLRTMTDTSIVSLFAGTAPGNVLDVRYWVDPAYSATTSIVLWSVCDVSPPAVGGIPYTVNIFNDAENQKSVNIEIPNEEVNVVDPALIVGKPADFIDGFIRFTVPTGAHPNVICAPVALPYPGEVNDMFVFSYINSDLIGAMQTLLAGE
jgi:hypothetical protein